MSFTWKIVNTNEENLIFAMLVLVIILDSSD
jgi:hypothetical protein